jgi:hypothetical protein
MNVRYSSYTPEVELKKSEPKIQIQAARERQEQERRRLAGTKSLQKAAERV